MPRFGGIPVDTQPKQAVPRFAGSPVASQSETVQVLPDTNVVAPDRLPGVLGTINDFGNDLGDAVAHHLGNLPVGLAQLVAHGVKDSPLSLGATIGDSLMGHPGQSAEAGKVLVDNLDNQIAQREKNYQENVPTNVASVAGAGIGEVLPWLTGLGEARAAGIIPEAATKLSKLGQLAAEGGLIGALTPTTGGAEKPELAQLVQGDKSPSYDQQKLEQVGIGAAIGPALHGLGRGLGAIKNGVTDVIEHVRNPQAIADREILARQGGDDPLAAIQALRTAKPSVPGESITAAQANPSPEAVAQERILRNNPITGPALAAQDNANNAARLDVVKRLAGTDEELQAARDARREAVQPFIDQHLSPATPETRWTSAGKPLDDLLAKPGRMPADDFDALQQARKVVAQVKGGTLQEDDAVQALKDLEETVSTKKARDAFAGAFAEVDRNMIDPSALLNKIALMRNTGQGARATIRPALDTIAKTLKESQNTRGLVPADVLDSVRQNIKDYIQKPNGAMASAQEIAALDPLKAKLQALIEQHAPGYSDYLAQYAKLSEPINTMESVRQLLDPNAPHSLNSAGDPQLVVSRLRQVLRGDDRVRYPMSDAARKELDAVRDSLERRMISDNKIAASGSNTAADTARAQGSAIGRGLFGDPLAGKPGLLSRSIGIGLGGTLGHLIPVPGAGVMGAMIGGMLPEAAQGVNAKIAQRIGATAADSQATADAIERALSRQANKGKPSTLGQLLLLQDNTPALVPVAIPSRTP